MPTLIRTQAELLALTSRRARRGVRRVELVVPGYSRDVRRLQHQINRCLRTRGWAMANWFVFAGLVVLAGAWALAPEQSANPGAATVLVALAVLAGLFVAGKLTGLWLAQRRLRRAIASYRI
jgi:hypothetical protein